MSGLANDIRNYTPLSFNPNLGAPPANPYAFAGNLGNYGNPSTDLSYGNVGSFSNVGGGAVPQMDVAGMTGVFSKPVSANQLAGNVPNQLGGGNSGWSLGGALDKFGTLTDIIGTFGNIYAGIQMNKIAKEQLAFSKASYAENLKNQKKAYNNSSEARSRSAGVQNNWSDAEVNAHIAKRAM